jgi:DNA repair protein RecO (recombination protein O)
VVVKRVLHESAFVLHRYDWSESSLILEVFTRDHGRIALVAKGVKKPSSQFRPILLPLQPLQVSYGGDAEVQTLKSAEWVGGHIMPTGATLLAGYYLNELLMRLLARDDPHPELFDAYALTVRWLATQGEDSADWVLRAFELKLLQEIGLLPQLSHTTADLQALQPERRYVIVPEGGLRVAQAHENTAIRGENWLALHTAGESGVPLSDLVSACVPVAQELKLQLRGLVHYHCGVNTLRTREMMMQVRDL